MNLEKMKLFLIKKLLNKAKYEEKIKKIEALKKEKHEELKELCYVKNVKEKKSFFSGINRRINRGFKNTDNNFINLMLMLAVASWFCSTLISDGMIFLFYSLLVQFIIFFNVYKNGKIKIKPIQEEIKGLDSELKNIKNEMEELSKFKLPKSLEKTLIDKNDFDFIKNNKALNEQLKKYLFIENNKGEITYAQMFKIIELLEWEERDATKKPIKEEVNSLV